MLSALNQASTTGLEIPAVADPDIRAYLAELNAYLTGVVPNGERDNFLEETLDHLETAVEMSEGCHDSTGRAIQSYGSARKNAEAVIETWFNRQPQHESYIVRRMGIANSYAFALFGCADLAYWICLQLRVNLPSADAFQLPWSPAEIRRFIPEPLPFPEPSAQFAALTIFPLVVPFLLGWLCGRKVPVNAQQTVYSTLMPIIVSSYIIGVLLLPVTDGVVFAVFQTIFWLPVGCFMAYYSSSLAWRSRRRQFGSTAGTRAPG